MSTGRKLRDLPELAQTLAEMKEHNRDLIVPSSMMTMDIEQRGRGDNLTVAPVVVIERDDKPNEVHDIMDHVHTHFSQKLGIHGSYYRRMREEAQGLLRDNVNHWLDEEGCSGKKHLVRVGSEGVRAFLSDRYRPIDHLDLLTTAMQVVMGQHASDEGDENYANGAKCLSWTLTPTNMNVCLVNATYGVDLENLDAGVQKFDTELTEDAQGFLRARPTDKTKDDKPGGIVFPSARIQNSETGNGGLYVKTGLCEAVCMNTAWIGNDLAKVHLGKKMESEEFFSSETYKKINATIFAQVADIVYGVFNPQSLLVAAKKLKGLQKEFVEVKDALNAVVKLPGITEDIRDEILKNYEPVTGGTVFDFQRAITSSAHAYRDSSPETSWELEELGGAMVEKGMAAISA